ncbi:MAG: sorbosone dehydrogenase family protein [Rubrivivax sp.]|nr:MAG: sorbosone dehydrogenase family protein [Rubrivivax sp.]
MKFVHCLTLFFVTCLAACGEQSRLPDKADIGPRPTLVEPVKTALPTIHVAEARPWKGGEAPTAAEGLRVQAFATGLDHPRWLHVLPNGDVLVAESNAPPRPADGQGVKAWFQKLFMKKAGAGVPSANRITLLRDSDGDGRAEQREVFAQNLNSPFGMALVGDRFYVANTDGVVEFAYAEGNGMAEEEGRAAMWEIDRATGAKRLFATGLRNPNGMAWLPAPGGAGAPVLWTVANERDEIGSDLVPDYLTSVKDGAFYGWPYSWYGQHVDERVKPQRPDLVARAIAPDYALGAHVAALGLAAAASSPVAAALPGAAPGGVFIGEHGSWNRKPRSGYKVVYVGFADGRPQGLPVDVLTGFIGPNDEARGRPVGVAVDRRGGLLVADDVGNVVWRITPR